MSPVRARTATIRTPALYRCTVSHLRREGARHELSYPRRLWLVDLDDLPRPPWPLRALFGFHAADHLGNPRRSLRENVDAFLALHDMDVMGGRVLMLAQPRALGYAYDPFTAFWCHDRAGHLRCVIAEVLSTFGDRHCYLLRVDDEGRAEVAKELYVSPFFPVDGRYLVRFTLDDAHVSLTVVLRRPDGPRATGPDEEHTAFVATLRGERVVGAGTGPCAMAGHPFVTYRTIALIHYESWRLRRKKLSMRRRRHHPPQAGVDRSLSG